MNFGTLRIANHPVVKKLVETKQKAFGDRLLLFTNTAISCALSTVGDILQQTYQYKKKERRSWNYKRTAHVAITGIAIGPFCHYWYVFLDWWLPGRSLKTVMKKIFVDQVICSPIVIGSFLGLTCFMEGKTWPQTKKEVIEKSKILYKAEWIVWPPAQVINFCVLPLKYRVLFDNTVSLGFDFYFSHVKYDEVDDNMENCDTAQEKEVKQTLPVYQTIDMDLEELSVGAEKIKVSGRNVGTEKFKVSGRNVGTENFSVSGRNVGTENFSVSGRNVGTENFKVSGRNVLQH